jgi:chromosomal replication initiator protein
VGARNNFAYAAAMAVAKEPGKDYNPLFLYSDVGLGKTHLLNSIANYVIANTPDLRLLYTSIEEFTSELVEAIRSNTIREFRAYYRSADILLIDDVQFLAEKERAQEEFFQVFNLLHQGNRQIVMTSDRPPKEISHLEKRLRSRFGAGIIVDIQAPDLETRMAILRSEAQRAEFDIEESSIALIAKAIATNVRDLKATLNQVVAQARIIKQFPNEEMVRQVIERVAG